MILPLPIPLCEDFSFGSLRMLKSEDASRMLEWMHSSDTSRYFQFDFSRMEIDDVMAFIKESHAPEESIHFAIADSTGQYLGTISLKNIVEGRSAEYAISMHPCAQGSGAAAIGTRDILKFAFEVLKLHRVYLNVRADNLRAIRFYEKMHFIYEGTARDALFTKEGYVDLVWFSILKTDWRDGSTS